MSWEDQAENWLAWARTPGHDAYCSYRDAFFPLLPAPGRRTLEVGCGEGRVARDLTARSHRVVGLDSSLVLLRHAAAADAGGRYVRADASALPLGTPRSTRLGPTTRSLREPVDPRDGVRQGRRLPLVHHGSLRQAPMSRIDVRHVTHEYDAHGAALNQSAASAESPSKGVALFL